MYTIFAPVHPVLSKQNAPRRHPYGRHLLGGAFKKTKQKLESIFDCGRLRDWHKKLAQRPTERPTQKLEPIFVCVLETGMR